MRKFLIGEFCPKGFTLVETLLYLAITSFLLLAIAGFLPILIEARVKSHAIAEVEQQGDFALRVIIRALQNAESLNLPAVSESGQQLSLNSYSSANNPIIFDAGSGSITESVGGQPAIALTAQNVVVSNASFANLANSGASGSVRVQFTLTYLNPSQRNEYSYSETFYGSGTLKK